jgi:hypothetical protein
VVGLELAGGTLNIVGAPLQTQSLSTFFGQTFVHHEINKMETLKRFGFNKGLRACTYTPLVRMFCTADNRKFEVQFHSMHFASLDIVTIDPHFGLL